MTPSFSPEDIARMRAIIAQHDGGASAAQSQKEFDLANPPVPPYRHQEYPRCMYHPDGRTRNANNAEEQATAEANGWLTSPNVAAVETVDDFTGLSAEDKAEAARLDEKLAEGRKRGRPSKNNFAA